MSVTYNIYWSTSPGVTKYSNKIADVLSSVYVNTNLAQGTRYYYVVTSVGPWGESDISKEVSAVTQPPIYAIGQSASAIMSTINVTSLIYKAVAGGAAAEALLATLDATAIAAKPTYLELLGAPSTEGTEVEIDTGATYTYSEASGAGWLRKEVYDAGDGVDPVLRRQLTGAVLPGAESPVWTYIKNDGGTGISTNGEYLTVGSTQSYWNQHIYNNEGTWQSEAMFYQGYIELLSRNTTDDRDFTIQIRNGQKATYLSYNYVGAGNKVRLTSQLAVPIGTAHKDVDLLNNRLFMEVLIYKTAPYSGTTGNVYVWFGNEETPSLSCPYSSLTSDAGFQVGVYAYATAVIKIKDFKFFQIGEIYP